MSNNTVRDPAQLIIHALKILGDIQALANIGEQAISNELPVPADNYDVLFASIGHKAESAQTELDNNLCLFSNSQQGANQ